MNKEEAKLLVEMSNRSINAYTESFTRGKTEFTFAEWMKYQEGLQVYIRSSYNIVHMLHIEGFTEYKINMQSGLIS